MKNLTRLFYESMCEVKSVGLEPGDIVNVSINSRAKNRWGQTRRVMNSRYDSIFSIDISDRLLHDNVSDEAAKETIIHEIIHTIPGCFDHGRQWQIAAEKINAKYPKYNIKRTNSPEEKGIQVTNDDYKYIVSCDVCHKEYGYNRAAKVIKNPNHFRCVCGGTLSIKTNTKAK